MAGLGKCGQERRVAVVGVLLSTAAAAQAQRAPSVGDGTPWGQTGIQLYDFSSYLGRPTAGGAGEIDCPAPPAAATPNCVGPPAPTTQAGRLERVFAWLQSKDIRNVELYGYPGNPFPTATNRRRRTTPPACRR